MITKFFSRACIAFALGLALVINSGCGGSGGSSSGSVDPAKVSELEAKVMQGDANAAFQLAELYANSGGSAESRIEAAKWAHISGRMGHSEAKLILDAMTSQMTPDDQLEAELRVEKINYPKPQ